jgi:transcriptional regulator with XRE-family HTH domain
MGMDVTYIEALFNLEEQGCFMTEFRDHPLGSVRHRRQLLRLPATYFANRIGVTVTTFNRFERGERRAYFDQAIAIAKALGCALEDLGRPVTPEEEFELFKRGQQTKRGTRDDGIVVAAADDIDNVDTREPEPPAPPKPMAVPVDPFYSGDVTKKEALDKLLAEWPSNNEEGDE